MQGRETLNEARVPAPRDAFEALKGRPPATDQELSDWLASDEGKAATAFETTSASRWGEIGRS